MNRSSQLKTTLLAAACLAAPLLAAQAHADDPQILCFNAKEAPGDLSEWRVACSSDHIYADVRFRPIDESSGEAQIHVTSWGVCGSNQRIVCSLNSGFNEGCFEEGTYPWIEYDGFVYSAELFCGCFDYGTDQCL
jgi:hypothetical protein